MIWPKTYQTDCSAGLCTGRSLRRPRRLRAFSIPNYSLALVRSNYSRARSSKDSCPGLHRSPFTGFSTEFTEYRQYNQGDDLRYLDWRLLGRTDRYFIKKYRADTNTQCHLLIDTSASMSYASSSSVTKLQYAQFLSASLAYLLNRQQDAVGLVAFDQKVHTHVPARNRTGHMRTIFGHLSDLRPAVKQNYRIITSACGNSYAARDRRHNFRLLRRAGSSQRSFSASAIQRS